MGYNLSVRCNTHKESMGILRGYENAGIARFRSEHPRSTCGDLESNIDNGYEAEEWGPGEGYEEKVFPDDYGVPRRRERDDGIDWRKFN